MIRSGEPVYIAVDSTGVKVHNSGDWVRRRFKARKGYLKLHIAVDTETKQIVALEATFTMVRADEDRGEKTSQNIYATKQIYIKSLSTFT